MACPRSLRILSSDMSITSVPPTRICPLRVVRRRLCRPMMDRLVTLLPEPDSPTMPRVFPRSITKDTPSTALTTPSSVANRTLRSLTCRYGSVVGLAVMCGRSFSAQLHARINDGVHQVYHDIG